MSISKEFKVGLLAIVSIAILYLGFNFLKGIDIFSSSNKFYVYYENINGLTLSNSVKIKGYSVGRVSNIKFVQSKNKVLVELDINEEVVLGKSAVAELTSELLGDNYIVLDVGDISQPLTEGDTLTGVEELGVMETIKDSTDPFKSTMVKVNNLITKFDGTRQKLDSLLIQLNKTARGFSSGMEENRRSFQITMNNLAGVTQKLNDEKTGLKPILMKMGGVADTLQNIQINQSLAKLNTTLDSFRKTIELINNGNGSMTKFLKNDSLYMNLNKTAEDLDKLMIDLRENPGRYVQFSVFGKKEKKKKDK